MQRTGSMTIAETIDQAPAAIALLGAGGTIERATSLFIDRFGESNAQLEPHLNGVERILSGHLDRLSLTVEGADAELSAVVDAGGAPRALLSIPSAGKGAATDSMPGLDEAIESSPAVVWLKDLDGRYLAVNARYEDQLRTEAEHVCGKTEAELAPAESIEGFRQRGGDAERQEPLELEYTAGAFDGRPAFAVLRFALRDETGQPTAVCGVAAPVDEARLARAECERLMRIERWSRLDEIAISEELLDEWGFARVSSAVGATDVRSDFERIEQELAEARAAALTLREELEATQAEAERAAQEEAERAQEEAERAAQTTTGDTDPGWDPASQRALAAALAGASEWRAVLKEAVKTIGAKGRWDAAVAWGPDDRRGSMRCVAMWTDEAAGLGMFETRTWQHRQDVSKTEFGRARSRSAPTGLLELKTAEDELLRAAAEAGLSSAVLVPIRDDRETIGMLELLSRAESSPGAELMLSLEGIALHLGGVARLLNLAASPHWGLGRL
jgi:PAS domain S-box-containing protein